MALLRAVGSEGRVISYEIREDFAQMARDNVAKFFGPAPNWTLKVDDVALHLEEKEIDRPLTTAGTKATASTEDVYGIHVVLPGDNIWNIHFQFLKDYFDHRGIALSPLADEPDRRGVSSGVGKLLKFSENMVYIYNLRERKVDADLSLIHPLSKVVVFKMKQVFRLLDGIDYDRVNRIQFDGETLWIPANQ